MTIDKQTLAAAIARARALSLAAALLGSVLPASAALVVYTDLSAYQAALGASIAADDFSDLTPGAALAGPLARSAGGIGYAAQVASVAPGLGATDFYPVAPAGNTALSSNFADATQLFDQFSRAVRGVSGDFSSTDEFGAYQAGRLNFVLVDQDGSFIYSWTSSAASSFLGFLSNGSITSLSLSAVQPGAGFNYAAVDNLGLAGAVPEPDAAALGVLGLGMMGLATRVSRRQRQG